MNYLDIYFRALADYRKNTRDFRDCINQRASTYKANPKNDILTIVRKICTVDTDWVEAIEEGMVHVEKALKEERQFIRSNGEVIDIEKVKNVSKDSVEHLSRHSNLITRYEEGEDVVPDRLYTVERLSDYAVYENRFLYMLLCYLRDFITVRYNKILELEHTYNGSMEMNKTIVMTKRSLNFEIKLSEERKDDLYLKRQSESRDIIVRIGNQLKLVLAFLATPLMQEVSKSPMLKPPITKTNVLRMNHNFRGAMALYEYISAYDKPGYTATESVSTQNPFRMDVADEMAEIVMLASFLTYEHGLNLKNELQIEYDLEEERRKEEEKRKLQEQLRALKHRIRESGESPEEYMLMLEKVNRLLREDSEKLAIAKQEIEQYKNEISTLENQKRALTDEVARLNGEIERLNQEHEKKLIEMENEHRAEIVSINEANDNEKAEIKADYEGRIDAINKSHGEEKASLEDTIAKNKAEHTENVARMEADRDRIVESIRAMWQAEVRDLKGVCEKKDGEIAELNKEKADLDERRSIAVSRLNALRFEHGFKGDAEDFTSEASFAEIERQLDTFIIFFKKQWGKTKKSIRRQAVQEFLDSIKAEKKKKKSKGEEPTVEATPSVVTEKPMEKAEEKEVITKGAMLKMADLEKPKAEEAPKAEIKVEEPKAEEAPKAEIKVEEPKAEPKADAEPKTEEVPKAEAEPKADTEEAEDTTKTDETPSGDETDKKEE